MCCHNQGYDYYHSHGCCCYPPGFYRHAYHGPLHKGGRGHDECCCEPPETEDALKAEHAWLKNKKTQLEERLQEIDEMLKKNG